MFGAFEHLRSVFNRTFESQVIVDHGLRQVVLGLGNEVAGNQGAFFGLQLDLHDGTEPQFGFISPEIILNQTAQGK